MGFSNQWASYVPPPPSIAHSYGLPWNFKQPDVWSETAMWYDSCSGSLSNWKVKTCSRLAELRIRTGNIGTLLSPSQFRWFVQSLCFVKGLVCLSVEIKLMSKDTIPSKDTFNIHISRETSVLRSMWPRDQF